MRPGNSIERRLEGQRIAVTGKLASMSRDEVVERIADAGGRYVPTPNAETDVLVVGEGGPPLGATRSTSTCARGRRSATTAT